MSGSGRRHCRRVVLIVGGLDPSGGAGILLDCRAARAGRVHPSAVVSLRTIQDGNRFDVALPEDADVLERSVSMMMSRFQVDGVKVGALGNAANVRVMAALADRNDAPPVVLDPVLSSTSRGELLDAEALEEMTRSLIPKVALVTPNLKEAEALTGAPVTDLDTMRAASDRLLDSGASSVLIKGGHLEGEYAVDLFVDRTGCERVFRAKRIHGEVRGTGCALATLIASFVANGAPLINAVERAKGVLTKAIEDAYRLGDGPAMLGEFEI